MNKITYKQIGELREKYEHHNHHKSHTLTAYAVLDSIAQKYRIEIVERLDRDMIAKYGLRKQREPYARLMAYKAVVASMREIGFKRFTVVLEEETST